MATDKKWFSKGDEVGYISSHDDQGVLITEITADFVTVMEGFGSVTYIKIKETRMT